ncbi:FAD-binding domain-containing protein [Schizopora paradoxa]|uniref:FAD-binding domain-containing protein n=1 Tax=Schizopora paradoxa TaxID=27342 RepID=A0A0H2RJL0_9AGAM|nr:FAD-binding domain-containing protein [Schizopora paradoxa]
MASVFLDLRRYALVLLAIFGSLELGSASKPHPEVRTSLPSGAQKACQILQQEFPGLVAFPGSTQFVDDNEHWAVTSESNSTCSVEPQTVDDISTILQLVGRSDIRSPFAVKSGGHAYNLGFSSTPGVQIAMSKFNNLSVNAEKKTATIGVGLTWDKVYQMLEPFGVMVTGGRIPGIGVGGLSLGGGYSWKTNQFGLTVDTIASFDLVLPTGKQVHVTNQTNPDLFFALKGGQNNFGIVTSIEFETHPQSQIWLKRRRQGGSITYAGNVTDSLNLATANFSINNTDPKAQMIVTYASVAGQSLAQVFPFYDGPTPPAGIFDAFLSIPNIATNVSTQSFVEFMDGTFGTGDLGIGPFGIAQHVIPIVQYTIPVLEQIVNQVTTVGEQLTAQNNGSIVVVSVGAEPFLKPNSHDRGGAYPHSASRQITPASPFIGFQTDPTLPAAVQAAKRAPLVPVIKQFTHAIQAAAVSQGQSQWDDVLYPNYALSDTPLNLLFGENVPRLQALARKYDPQRVMSLTGGFSLLD